MIQNKVHRLVSCRYQYQYQYQYQYRIVRHPKSKLNTTEQKRKRSTQHTVQYSNILYCIVLYRIGVYHDEKQVVLFIKIHTAVHNIEAYKSRSRSSSSSRSRIYSRSYASSSSSRSRSRSR